MQIEMGTIYFLNYQLNSVFWRGAKWPALLPYPKVIVSVKNLIILSFARFFSYVYIREYYTVVIDITVLAIKYLLVKIQLHIIFFSAP